MTCLEERMQQWCVEVWVDTRIKVGCVCVGERCRRKWDRVDSEECWELLLVSIQQPCTFSD